MIRKGTSRHEKFILRKKGETAVISGTPSAFFGYMANDTHSESPEGVWARWRFENDSFELINDRFGFYPLYYYKQGSEFGVSNSIIELVKHGAPVSLDDTAISVFLRLGYYIGDDTPFKEVRAVPPAARMRWSPREGVRIDSGDRTPRKRGSAPLTRKAAVRRFGELFQSTMEKLLPIETGGVVLPLSGGRDSRHILFALARSGRPPDCCVTVRHIPPRQDEDAVVAAEVARFLNVPHEILSQRGNLLHGELRKNNLTNFCADEHSWLLPLRDFLRDRSFSISYDGIGGDVLAACAFLNDKRHELYKKGKLDELAQDVLGPEEYLPRMLHPSFYQRWNRDVAVNHLARELQRYSACPNPLSQFVFWNRTRREIALSPWCMLNVSGHVIAPYLSEEIYDFLAALPASYLLDKNFHTDAVTSFYPEYAHLPFETTKPFERRNTPRAIAVLASGMARYFLSTAGVDKSVNHASFLLPVLLRGILNADIGTQLPHICNKAIYLRQLALLKERPSDFCSPTV